MKLIEELLGTMEPGSPQQELESVLQIANIPVTATKSEPLQFVVHLGRDGIVRKAYFIATEIDYGILTEQLIGRALAEIAPPPFWPKVREAIDAVYRENGPQTLNSELTLSGQTFVLELLITANGPDELIIFGQDRTEEKEREAKTVALNRALIAVQAAAAAISLNLDHERVLETFNWEMTHLLDGSGCGVYFYEQGVDKISLAANYVVEEAAESIAFAAHCRLNDFPFLRQVLRDRYPLQIDVDDEIHAAIDLSDLRAMGVTRILLLPLVFQDRVMGVAKVALWQTDRRFTNQEISLAQLLTNQTAAAMANAHLYNETEQRLREQTALRKASNISAASLNQKVMLQQIAQHLTTVVTVKAVVIRNYDSGLHSGRIIAFYRPDEQPIPQGSKKEILFSPKAIAAFAAETPIIWQSEDPDVTYNAIEDMAAYGADLLMAVPMMVAGRVIAVAELWTQRHGQPFTIDEIELVRSIAQQAAIAMENARLYQELTQRHSELSTLNAISQAISSTLDLEETLTIITDSVVKLLSSRACSVALISDDGASVRYVAASGAEANYIVGQELSIGDGIVGWVVRHGEAVITGNVSQDPRHYRGFDQASGFSTDSLVCVPLQSRGITIGAISIFNKTESSFDEEDLRLLQSLAIPASTAIENAMLFRRASLEIEERKRAEINLEAERASLANRVEERTLELQRANETLARAARMKDEFLASMSHELRTPLNAILGISQGLVEQFYGPHNERQLKSLRLINQSGRHLLELINDILDISKIEADRLTINIELVSVQDVCNESLRLVKQSARDKSLSLDFSIADEISVIYADQRRLKQILINLLSNAVKFTPAGGQVGLDVSFDKVQDIVRFSVWDTGIGIPEDKHDQLFQPFIQLDSRLSRNYAGTGLGLALVRRLTEMHGGEISLASTPGQGSRFTVSLPRRSETKQPEPLVSNVDDLAESAVPLSEQPPISDNPVILLVDDDEFVASVFADLLTKMGCQIIKAVNGLEALEQFQQRRPDLILMDIQMPKMDGLEAMRRIRALPNAADVPIIALTALAMAGDRELCLEAGADEYLSKPVPLQTLKATINEFIERSESEP